MVSTSSTCHLGQVTAPGTVSPTVNRRAGIYKLVHNLYTLPNPKTKSFQNEIVLLQ